MTNSVEEACQTLIQSLKVNTDVSTTHSQRLEAHKFYEDFKANAPFCAPCGLRLADHSNDPIVRHMGLQLLEHCIKFRWNSMSPEEKLSLKESILNLIRSGTLSVLEEPAHIKDALSRLVGEIAKREWPQQWPNFIEELAALAAIGPTQREFVLLILLRLAEDVVQFQTVENGQRRRDLYQALVAALPELFRFFMQTLESSYTIYSREKVSNSVEGQIHCRLTRTLLLTLSGFMDWVPVQHLGENDFIIVNILCFLLSDPAIRHEAALSLLELTDMKGKLELRKPLMMSFTRSEILGAICGAVKSVINADSDSYVFAKVLAQCMCNISKQFAFLSQNSQEFKPSEMLPGFFDALFDLFKHPSIVISNYALTCFITFLRCKATRDFCGVVAPPFLEEAISSKLMKWGYPGRSRGLTQHPNAAAVVHYSQMEFDGDLEFVAAFGKYRVDLTDCIKQFCQLAPRVGFGLLFSVIQSLMSTEISQTADSDCIEVQLLYIRWEATIQFADAIIPVVLSSDKSDAPTVTELSGLLEAALVYRSTNLTVQSYSLSILSACYSILEKTPPDSFLPRVLDLLFSFITFELPNESKSSRSEMSKNLRRHACYSFLNLCKLHSKMVFTKFDAIQGHIIGLFRTQMESFIQLEISALCEALLALSNEFENYERQTVFVGEVLARDFGVFTGPNIKLASSSVDAFMTYFGLNLAPEVCDVTADDGASFRRAQLLACLHSLSMALKRLKAPPVGSSVSISGGYEGSDSRLSFPFSRHPAASYFFQCLEPILQMTRIYNYLFSEENLAKWNAAYLPRCIGLLEAEKSGLVNTGAEIREKEPSPAGGLPPQKNAVERLHTFVANFHENFSQLIGAAVFALGAELYLMPSFSTILAGGLLDGWQHLPNYRVCRELKVLWRPLIANCPEELKMSCVLPLLQLLCPFLFQKLEAKWRTFKAKYGGIECLEDAMTEQEEIIDDQITRIMSREYIELLAGLMLPKPTKATGGETSNGRENDDVVDGAAEVDMMDSTVSATPSKGNLSEFGKTMLQTEALRSFIVASVYNSLQWSDSVLCGKALVLCFPVFKQLMNMSITNEELLGIYRSIMEALWEHGEHEVCRGNLLLVAYQIYEALPPGSNDTLRQLMLQIPSCDPAKLQALDNAMFPQAGSKPQADKKRREMFKNLMSAVVGKNVGQQHKHIVEIRNLAPILKPRKACVPSFADDDFDEGLIGLAQLF